MVKYRSSVLVPYARDRVWRLMSDWTNLSGWDVNIAKSELAADQKPGQIGVGTKYNCTFKRNGMEFDVDYECIKYEEPAIAQYLGLATLFRSQDSVECEIVSENETRITAEFNLSFRGILSPFSFIMKGDMQKTGPIVMSDIEKFVKEQLDKNPVN